MLQPPADYQGTTAPVSLRPITFDQIATEVAAYWAEQNAPAAIACRTIETLTAALEGCTVDERAEVLALLADEIRPIIAGLAQGGSNGY